MKYAACRNPHRALAQDVEGLLWEIVAWLHRGKNDDFILTIDEHLLEKADLMCKSHDGRVFGGEEAGRADGSNVAESAAGRPEAATVVW